MPWFEGALDDAPLWVSEFLLAKLTTERKAKAILEERALHAAKRR